MALESPLAALRRSVELRMPQVPRSEGPRARIDQLEDYMLKSAWHQGELAQARLETHDALRTLEDEWDDLEGWQSYVRQNRTNAGIEDAKRQRDPRLHKAIKHARWLVARLSEEIDRLERDAKVCSRAYTFATGS
jgi:hypothetical protein